MHNYPQCPFKNKYMTKPCNRQMLKNHNEWYCISHGTITFEREAWDTVETPPDTYEAENGGSSWSQDEIALLIQLDEDGVPVLEIARRLGRSRNATYNKLWSLRGKG